jgi:hypothetical protein
MRSFILLYSGPPAPPGASHEGWPEWFQSLGDKLVDIGSSMADGFVVHADGTRSEDAARLAGFCIVRAEDEEEVLELARTHPVFAAGDYAIEVFAVPMK